MQNNNQIHNKQLIYVNNKNNDTTTNYLHLNKIDG
jgi:hypothetical protein